MAWPLMNPNNHKTKRMTAMVPSSLLLLSAWFSLSFTLKAKSPMAPLRKSEFTAEREELFKRELESIDPLATWACRIRPALVWVLARSLHAAHA